MKIKGIFKKLANLIKYSTKDKEYISDILIPEDINSFIIGTNHYSRYCNDNDDIANMSNITILLSYKRNNNIVLELNRFIVLVNTLNLYAVTVNINDSKECYMLIDGSIRDYDRLISYMKLGCECKELIEMHYEDNIFLNHIKNLIKMIPSDGFKYCIDSEVLSEYDFSYENNFEWDTDIKDIDKAIDFINHGKIDIIEYDKIHTSENLPLNIFSLHDLINMMYIYISIDNTDIDISDIIINDLIIYSSAMCEYKNSTIMKIKIGDFIQYLFDNKNTEYIDTLINYMRSDEKFNVEDYNFISDAMVLFRTCMKKNDNDDNENYYNDIDEII